MNKRVWDAKYILCGLTLGICGAADDVGELGLEAREGRAVLAHRLEPSGAQRQHTLQWRVRPQTFTLVDGQGCGVIDQESSILKMRRKMMLTKQG